MATTLGFDPSNIGSNPVSPAKVLSTKEISTSAGTIPVGTIGIVIEPTDECGAIISWKWRHHKINWFVTYNYLEFCDIKDRIQFLLKKMGY